MEKKKKDKKRKPSSAVSVGAKAIKKAAKAAAKAKGPTKKVVKNATPPPVPKAAKRAKAVVKASKAVKGSDVPNLVMKRKDVKPDTAIFEKRLPDSKVVEKASGLKPVSKVNVKNLKEGVPDKIVPNKVAPKKVAPQKKKVGTVTKVKKKSSPVKKAALAGAGIAAVVGVNNKSKTKSKKEIKSDSKSIDKSKQPAKSKLQKASPRNANNAKVKPSASKAPTTPAGSTSDAVKKATSSPQIKKKFPKGVPPKLRSEAVAKARASIAKQRKSNVPWEKILESITVLISSHILSRGISKRGSRRG